DKQCWVGFHNEQNDVPSQLDGITPCFIILVDAKETPDLFDTGCPWTTISQCLHKALIKESQKAAMAFQQHQDFNPLRSVNSKAVHAILSGPYLFIAYLFFPFLSCHCTKYGKGLAMIYFCFYKQTRAIEFAYLAPLDLESD
uniref:Uncharacterized protein n=1 Tax=Romanomermis culicivorax TaxID=13658 RepID=A0A915KZP3_ROMCU